MEYLKISVLCVRIEDVVRLLEFENIKAQATSDYTINVKREDYDDALWILEDFGYAVY